MLLLHNGNSQKWHMGRNIVCGTVERNQLKYRYAQRRTRVCVRLGLANPTGAMQLLGQMVCARLCANVSRFACACVVSLRVAKRRMCVSAVVVNGDRFSFSAHVRTENLLNHRSPSTFAKRRCSIIDFNHTKPTQRHTHTHTKA